MTGQFLGDPRVVELIGRTAHRLRRRPELQDQDAEDLAQDLSLGLLKRFPGLSPDDKRFMAMIVRGTRSAAASLVRSAGCQKRDRRRVKPQRDDVAGQSLDTDCRRATSDPYVNIDSRDDAASVLRRALDGDLGVCLLLGRVNLSEAVRSLGITRKQLSQKLDRIRLAVGVRNEEHPHHHGRKPRRDGVVRQKRNTS